MKMRLAGCLASLALAQPAVAVNPGLEAFARAEIARAAADSHVPEPSVRFPLDQSLGAQAYRFERTGDGALIVWSGDPAGALYGGLDAAEAIRLGPESAAAILAPGIVHRPRIVERGLKLNVPLDARARATRMAATARAPTRPKCGAAPSGPRCSMRWRATGTTSSRSGA